MLKTTPLAVVLMIGMAAVSGCGGSSSSSFSPQGGSCGPDTVPQVTVTSISPGAGPAAGGTLVTINGGGFTACVSSLTVQFVGAAGVINAANLKVVSDSQLTCSSPPGIGPVAVEVVATHGTTSATSNLSTADQFTYQ